MTWAAWQLLLQSISSDAKLERRLGSWLTIPHQKWYWFYNPTTVAVYHQTKMNDWIQFEWLPQTQSTRHRSKHYNNLVTIQPPLLAHCFPTLVTQEGDSIFSDPSSFQETAIKIYHHCGSQLIRLCLYKIHHSSSSV